MARPAAPVAAVHVVVVVLGLLQGSVAVGAMTKGHAVRDVGEVVARGLVHFVVAIVVGVSIDQVLRHVDVLSKYEGIKLTRPPSVA